MSALGELQRKFPLMLAKLIVYTYQQPGYELALGELERTQLQANANAVAGIGISNSLHTKCLAIDVKLFINGVYQTDSAAYKVLGEYWESLGGSWGGRFAKPDGDHFSLSPDGGKTR